MRCPAAAFEAQALAPIVQALSVLVSLRFTYPAPPSTPPTIRAEGSGDPENGAESVLTPCRPTGYLPAKTARRSTITQIYEGTNQIQRMVMARQLLKG